MNLKEKVLKNHKLISTIFKSFEQKEHLYDVYYVDVKKLILNPYNGRFRASSHDSDIDDISFTEQQKMAMIESQSKDKFDELCKSVEIDGQNEPLIVNWSGVVIDGNRRLSVLNKIGSKFAKVIFTIGEYNSQLEIERLETKIQFGNPDKETYSPLNKEIKAANIYKNQILSGASKVEAINYAVEVMHIKKSDVEFAIFKQETIDSVFRLIGKEPKYKWFEGTTDQFKSLKTIISKTFDSKSSLNKDEWYFNDEENKQRFIIASVKLIMCKTKAVAGTRILFGSGKKTNIVSNKILFDEYIAFIENNIDWDKVKASSSKKGKTAYSDLADKFVQNLIEKINSLKIEAIKEAKIFKVTKQLNESVINFSEKFIQKETDKAYYHMIKAKEAIINAQKYLMTDKAKREAQQVFEEAKELIKNIGK